MITIERVAIVHNGIIYSLPRPFRHHDVMKVIWLESGSSKIDGEQGFVTSDGRFVTREEARVIAEEAGQLLDCARDSDILLSEELW